MKNERRNEKKKQKSIAMIGREIADQSQLSAQAPLTSGLKWYVGARS